MVTPQVKQLWPVGLADYTDSEERDVLIRVFDVSAGEGPVCIGDTVRWRRDDGVMFQGTVMDRRGDVVYLAVLGLPRMWIAALAPYAATGVAGGVPT
jgi:hypothetical protein